MAKRRLSKQQQRRIDSKQKSKIHNDLLGDGKLQLDEASTQTARVISHHGRQLYAETEELKKIKCKIRQNLGDIACGDYVVVQQAKDPDSQDQPTAPHSDASQYVVVAVKERSNLLVKTGFAGAIKPVAANIGQLVIVTALKPKPNPYLIDRYLTAAENLPAKALIVINKADLMDHETKRTVDDLTKLYSGIGYDVICTSMKQDLGLEALAEALSNTTSILVGLSGVGKSSIVKAILPKEEIKIGDTSQATGEGKHTTTVSALYHLKDNGIIIDSPGVRDFTPINNSIDEITNGFKDIRKFSGACKFSNCSHTNEPGCAIKQAASDGLLDEQRFKNYLRLIQEFNEQQ
ncbi:MAG: ribosome small subunit-dependent GTPase A [Gammaproteobacteria bacterium]|nr:ribosome small subunit-dependent GTPase A [Gammaproteobacteria bacterium]NNJ50167.1 ribosome small subunit-dependent GTPase A [Gammaproteobacteria bacterium]